MTMNAMLARRQSTLLPMLWWPLRAIYGVSLQRPKVDLSLASMALIVLSDKQAKLSLSLTCDSYECITVTQHL